MKLAIMQPYFFPYLGYWQLINSVDVFVLYDDVNFIKKGWINRNNILLDGHPHLLTMPLKNISQWKLINEIQVIEDNHVKNSLLSTIIHAYKKAPYFNDVFPIVEQVIKENGIVSEVLEKSLRLVCKYCSIDTNIILSSKIEKDNTFKGQNKIVEICKKLKASDYINAIGGKALYSKDVFSANNINLHFIKMKNEVRYTQFQNTFIPNLSIIDVLMFNSKAMVCDMLNQYELC